MHVKTFTCFQLHTILCNHKIKRILTHLSRRLFGSLLIDQKILYFHSNRKIKVLIPPDYCQIGNSQALNLISLPTRRTTMAATARLFAQVKGKKAVKIM